MTENVVFIVVAASDRLGPYWLTRELGVDVLPAVKRADGQYIVVNPAKIEDRYWEESKYLHNPKLREVAFIPRPEKHELLAKLERIASKEIIDPKFVVKEL